MKKPIVSIIVALSENNAIGNNGKIPWHIKEDLVRFKEKTIGHTVIMGRKSFEWMMRYYDKSPNPLPNRVHIIVTRNQDYTTNTPKIIVVNSIEEAIKKAKEIESNEIFVAGGGQIYTQALPYTDKLYLTLVRGKFEADTFFPKYLEFSEVISASEWKQTREHDFKVIG